MRTVLTTFGHWCDLSGPRGSTAGVYKQASCGNVWVWQYLEIFLSVTLRGGATIRWHLIGRRWDAVKGPTTHRTHPTAKDYVGFLVCRIQAPRGAEVRPDVWVGSPGAAGGGSLKGDQG